ncbi:ATPase [Knoellia sinensis KCTC 19936]|uniref:ATP synthase subunit a n=1 Tax=Knoellia sinensis KCTC 19936 TaxID=1385520 RepID=A0A0A0JGY9_9MICO|nr:ATPase [Knoellia sinensis KCTC 19936]
MILTALAAGTTTAVVAADEGGEFTTPSPDIFWLPLIGEGNWAITEQMVWGGVSVLVLSVAMVALSRNAAIVPSKGQWLMEGFYNFARNGVARDMIGTKHFLKFVPLLFSLFALILLNNWMGILPPVMNPTMGKIGFPIALTLVVYVVYHWIGIKKHGVKGYFAHMVPDGLPGWIKPAIFFLELITYFITRPLTLALRLFGNMFAGHMLIVLFVSAGAFFLTQGVVFKLLAVPTFIMAAVMFLFEALVQFLQAYVFTLLSASYIAGALADDH